LITYNGDPSPPLRNHFCSIERLKPETGTFGSGRPAEKRLKHHGKTILKISDYGNTLRVRYPVDLSRLLFRKCDRQQNPGRVFQGNPGFLMPALQETFDHFDALPPSLTGISFLF